MAEQNERKALRDYVVPSLTRANSCIITPTIQTMVLESGFYWPALFKEAYVYVKACNVCQRMGNINRRNEIPLNNILEVELFDVWRIDIMGPFPFSFSNQYILVAIDYVSK